MFQTILGGVEIDVANWHKVELEKLGFKMAQNIKIETKRMGFGKNGNKRCKFEFIMVFEKE